MYLACTYWENNSLFLTVYLKDMQVIYSVFKQRNLENDKIIKETEERINAMKKEDKKKIFSFQFHGGFH
jgi:protein tyrosine phosphatase